MEWLKKAPTTVVVMIIGTAGMLMLSTLVGFTVLIYAGKDVTEFRSLINTVINFFTLAIASVGAVAGVGAARSSAKTEDQTNGLQDAERDAIAKRAAAQAIALYRQGGGTL